MKRIFFRIDFRNSSSSNDKVFHLKTNNNNKQFCPNRKNTRSLGSSRIGSVAGILFTSKADGRLLCTCAEGKLGRGVPARWVALQAAIGSALAERRDRKRPCCGTQLVQTQILSSAGLPAVGAALAEARWGRRRSSTTSTAVTWTSTCGSRCKRAWGPGGACWSVRRGGGAWGLRVEDGC